MYKIVQLETYVCVFSFSSLFPVALSLFIAFLVRTRVNVLQAMGRMDLQVNFLPSSDTSNVSVSETFSVYILIHIDKQNFVVIKII